MLEVGLGIHGEEGARTVPLEPVDAIVDTLLGFITSQEKGRGYLKLARGDKVARLRCMLPKKRRESRMVNLLRTCLPLNNAYAQSCKSVVSSRALKMQFVLHTCPSFIRSAEQTEVSGDCVLTKEKNRGKKGANFGGPIRTRCFLRGTNPQKGG